MSVLYLVQQIVRNSQIKSVLLTGLKWIFKFENILNTQYSTRPIPASPPWEYVDLHPELPLWQIRRFGFTVWAEHVHIIAKVANTAV